MKIVSVKHVGDIHPAVGYLNEVTLENNSTFLVYDEWFMHEFTDWNCTIEDLIGRNITAEFILKYQTFLD